MKRIILASVSLVFFILLTCSCSNPRTLYEKGSYREAVKAVDRVREPSSDMILLKAKSYIALGEDGKALESLFLYLLQDESRSAPEREWAVGQFIRLNASDQLAVMVLSPEDGKDACRRLFSAYTALGETDKAREMYKIVSEGLSGRECAMLLLEENADNLVVMASPVMNVESPILNWQISRAVNRYRLPVIVCYVGLDMVDEKTIKSYWAWLPNKIRKYIGRDSAYMCHIPLTKDKLERALGAFSVNDGTYPWNSTTIF